MKNERISVLICDDDEVNVEINKKCTELYSQRLNKQVEVHCFVEVTDEMEQLIENEKIDMAILDIELKQGSGIDLATKLQAKKPKMPIIFVTNYDEYKSLAYDILAVGYFQKPFHTEKFEIVFERAVAQIELERNKEPKSFINLCIDRKNVNIRVSNIICVEKIQRKVQFKTRNGIFQVRGNISTFVELLKPNFLQVSQSVIVNTEEIISIDNNEVYLSTGDQFTIGRTFQKNVKEGCHMFLKH